MAFVAFFRGINVGGYRTFRPSILAKQLKDYGVVNIGAAGSFVFRNRVSQTVLRSEVLRCLPVDAEVMICTAQELIAAASDNPFASEKDGRYTVRFVSVLARGPECYLPFHFAFAQTAGGSSKFSPARQVCFRRVPARDESHWFSRPD